MMQVRAKLVRSKLGRAARVARALGRDRLRLGPSPLHASILVTSRCNLECAYCGRTDDERDPLDAGQWCGIVDELADLGAIQLSVTGGEPLLRKDLDVILRRARDRGMRINLNTNGFAVPRREETVRLAHRVTISLDGGPAVHDGVRGQGAHERVLAAGRWLQDRGIRFRTYTVLSRDNLDELGVIVDTAESLGGDAFFQPGTLLSLDGHTPNPLAPGTDQYRRGIDQLVAWKRQGRAIGNSLAGLRYLRNWPDPAPVRCTGERLFCRIEADGNMRTCGRDGQSARVSVLALGVREAMRRRPLPGCTSCWSAARAEFHLLAGGSPSALHGYLQRG